MHTTVPSSLSRWLPALLAIAVFMQLLDATILNTALPKMAEDLQQSALKHAICYYLLCTHFSLTDALIWLLM
nr:hypothetical protein [Suttonella ornithocola]